MKKSPYNLLQEIYLQDPWKMLVCCIMLNCTSRKQVDQVRFSFFKKYSTADAILKADLEEIKNEIALLGFKNRRANTIVRFSQDWKTLGWIDPKELYGIGKYAQDSWEIFQKKNLNVEPTDGVLLQYLAWAKTQPSEISKKLR